MKTTRTFLLATVVVGLLQGGCFAGADDLDIDGIGEVEGQTLAASDDPMGHTGTNGLVNDGFHLNKLILANAAWSPLYADPVLGTLSAPAQMLLSTEGGEATFKYAVRCAIQEGVQVGASPTHIGGGILGTTGAWLNDPLGITPTEDLFACMALHLNPSGTEVPIKLAGPAIQPKQDEGSASFTFKEALWATDVPSGGTPVIHVLPLHDLVNRCAASISEAMATRVCGKGSPSCGLVVHDLTELAGCTGPTPGVYTSCGGKRVIQTWLDPVNVPELYGICARRRR